MDLAGENFFVKEAKIVCCAWNKRSYTGVRLEMEFALNVTFSFSSESWKVSFGAVVSPKILLYVRENGGPRVTYLLVHYHSQAILRN